MILKEFDKNKSAIINALDIILNQLMGFLKLQYHVLQNLHLIDW